MLQEFPLDCDEVLGNDAFLGCEGEERPHHALPKVRKRARTFPDDGLAGREKFSETGQTETFGTRQSKVFGHGWPPSLFVESVSPEYPHLTANASSSIIQYM
jgi:hypothetical protein